MKKINNKKFIYDDITVNYIEMLRHNEDELGLIIKGHLIIEYIINKIIEKKYKNPKILFEDVRSFTFSVKLKMLYAGGSLPKPIYENILYINNIRNKFAHNLEVDFNKLVFKFYREDGSILIIKNNIKKKNPVREYIKMLCFGTLNLFRNYYIQEFGELPKLDL